MFIAYLHICLLLTHTKKGTADCSSFFRFQTFYLPGILFFVRQTQLIDLLPFFFCEICTFQNFQIIKDLVKTYKQMKMYNDPALNPVLYGQKK